MSNLVKNEAFTVEIECLCPDGSGICRIDGRAVFVKDALPGERHEIKILKAGRTAVFAKSTRRLVSSPDRIEPDCPYFPRCGGCTLRHVSYECELAAKKQAVDNAFRRIGGLDLVSQEIIGSDKISAYRNKAIYAIGSEGFGFYRSRSHDIIPIRRCALQPDKSDLAADCVFRFMVENGIEAFDERTRRGQIRHVFTRIGFETGQMQITIVSAGGLGTKTKRLIEAIVSEIPDVTSIILNINKTAGNTVLSGDFYTLYGGGTMQDRLCGFDFKLSPLSFYQINPPQAQRLYGAAVDLACEDSPGLVLELYCGAGTISLCLARRAGRVIGAEIVPSAIENAKENAARNGVKNVQFICADAANVAKDFAKEHLTPDVIVVDPPRKGLSPEVIDAMAQMGAKKIVYISCDCATQSRDLKALQEHGYTPQTAKALDMFPRTAHVETVVLLSRVEEQGY